MPVPLDLADLSKPFVYDRRYGLFYVEFAKHPFALVQLLAWDLGLGRAADVEGTALGLSEWRSRDVHALADHFLENTPGTCYRSSQSKKVITGKRGHLNEKEMDLFSPVTYLIS